MRRGARGGLAVDSREALLAGGDSGPAIVPGKPQASLLIDAVKRTGLEMPPEGKGEPLNEAEVALLERWVRDGAPAPASAGPAGPKKRRPGDFTEEDRNWWAIQPLRPSSLRNSRVTTRTCRTKSTASSAIDYGARGCRRALQRRSKCWPDA